MIHKGSIILLVAAMALWGCRDETPAERSQPSPQPADRAPAAPPEPREPAPLAGGFGRRIHTLIQRLTIQAEKLPRLRLGPLPRIEPDHQATMHVWLARGARLQRMPAKAAEHYRAAYRISGDVAHRRAQATMLSAAGAYRQAAQVYRRILAEQPHAVDVRYNLAVALTRTGRLTRAERQYVKVLEAQDDHLQARANLGMLYMHLEEYTFAARHLSRAVKLDSRNPSLRQALGQALLETHRAEEAMVELAELTHLSPENIMAWQGFSRAAFQAGSLGRALFAAKRALELARRQLGHETGAAVMAEAAASLTQTPSLGLEPLLTRAGPRALLAELHRHLGRVHLSIFYATGQTRHRQAALEAWEASLALVCQPDLRRRLDSHRHERGE